MKISKENQEFLDQLFANFISNVDTDMIDLQEDDSCDDHIQFEKLVEND